MSDATFTPPAVRPLMIRRWKISTKMIRGTVTMTPAAIWVPYGVSYWLMPENWAIATVTGCEAGVCDIEFAIMNSFQAEMKTRIAVVNTPGTASGRMIRRNAWTGVQPSTRAACSSSHGMARKKLVRIHTPSGSEKLMSGMIIAWKVSIQPRSANSWNSGVRIATPGNIEVARNRPSTKVLPRNSSRAIAYEAKTPNTSATTVTLPAMIRLLRRASTKVFCAPNTAP